jgi:hypothetical protein
MALEPTYPMSAACKHPRVRVVAREEDAEYVECLECGEVFDSDEFRDMQIEESSQSQSPADDEPDQKQEAS